MDTPTSLHIVVASRAVAPQHGFGGLESAVTHHLRGLTRRGVRVTVFTQPPYLDAPPPADFGGLVTWRELPYRASALGSRFPLRRNSIPDRLLHYTAFARALGQAIADLARREPVDIVHAHGLTGAGYAWSVIQRRNMARGIPESPPLVLNPHGLEEFQARNWAKIVAYAPFRRALRAAAAAAAAVIATDRTLVADVTRLLRAPRDKVVTIPNGVDIAMLDALARPDLTRDLRDRYGLADAPLTLMTVARLERNKGLREALLALAGLRDRLPAGWRWLIIGSGSEEARLRDLIRRHGFTGNVTLAGSLGDVDLHNLLESADLLLVPSIYEGSSLATLEGMVHRLPVVASATGGLPDKVRPGQTGFLTPPGDIAALGAALATALDRRADWPAYGARARALVAAEFDWTTLTERYLALYHNLLARAPAPPLR